MNSKIAKFLFVIIPTVIVIIFGIAYLSVDNKSSTASKQVSEINTELDFIDNMLDQSKSEITQIKQKTDENSTKIDNLSQEFTDFKSEYQKLKKDFYSDHEYINELRKVIDVND